MTKLVWPNKHRMAFSIMDDTDHATLIRIKPIYDRLVELNLPITKTVWAYPCNSFSKWEGADTLQVYEYVEYLKYLMSKGFELSWHGATGGDDVREVTEKGLELFKSFFGF